MKIPCPNCRSMSEVEGNPNRPFCSDRCRLIDLGQWAEGEYRVAGEKAPDPQEKEDI